MLTSILFFILVPTAFAFPSIGDKVTFALTISGSQGTQHGTLSHELTQYDATKKRWLEITTQQISDEAPKVIEEWQKTSDLQSPQGMGILLQACTLEGGQRGTTQVPAGNFETCAMNSGGSKYWFGIVPFAVVRFETHSGSQTNTGELTSVRAP